MKTMFMIDIESTGVDVKNDEILQIALLELNLKEDGFWHPNRSYQTMLHYGGAPTSEFARKHMTALYDKANNTPWRSGYDINLDIIKFVAQCLGKGMTELSPLDVTMCGANASGFDLPFLENKGILTKMRYITTAAGKDVAFGDYSYRVYELTGAIEVLSDVTQASDRKAMSNAAADSYALPLPEGKEHEALYDCYKQTKLLNGIIKTLRGLTPSPTLPVQP